LFADEADELSAWDSSRRWSLKSTRIESLSSISESFIGCSTTVATGLT
jgi:hypothetical protein